MDEILKTIGDAIGSIFGNPVVQLGFQVALAYLVLLWLPAAPRGLPGMQPPAGGPRARPRSPPGARPAPRRAGLAAELRPGAPLAERRRAGRRPQPRPADRILTDPGPATGPGTMLSPGTTLGLFRFTIEGRRAPGLFGAGWLATLVGAVGVVVGVLAGPTFPGIVL